MTVTDDLLSGPQAQPPPPPPAKPSVVDDLLSGPQKPPAAVKPEAQPPSFGERAFRTADDIMRAVAQGITFGGADELAAYLSSVTGVGAQPGGGPAQSLDVLQSTMQGKSAGTEYERNLAAERARQKEIPAGIAIPGEIAGGIMGSVAAAPAAAAAVPGRVAQVAARAPGWLKAMGFGGLFGGSYGFLSGEGGLEQRERAALQGGATGAVAAGVLHPIGGLIRKGAGKVGQEIRARISPEKELIDRIKQALARDNMTPAKLRVRLRELGPQATIADAAGKNTQRLAGTAAGSPGVAQNRIEQVLNQRAEGEGARIIRALNRGVDFDDFYAAEEGFLKNLREQAAPLYQRAYEENRSIMTPALNRIIRGSTGRKALAETAQLFETERSAGAAKYLGAVDKELTEALRAARDVGKAPGLGRVQPGVIKGFSLETWDQIKRGLDSLLDSPRYRNELTGRLNAQGRAVMQVKKTLLKELDTATGGERGAYATARKIYSGDAEVLDALREGRKAMNKDPEIILRELRDLSGAAAESYKSGAARAIRDVVDKTPDTASAARRLFGNARVRDRLRALFPGEDFDRLRKVLVAEQKFSQTKNMVLGGSPTREKLAAEKDLLTKAAGAAAIMGTGGGSIMLASMRRRAAESIFGPQNEKFLTGIAKMLVNRNPAMNQQALDKIFGRLGMSNAPLKVKADTANYLVPLIIGQQTGRLGAAQSGQ